MAQATIRAKQEKEVKYYVNKNGGNEIYYDNKGTTVNDQKQWPMQQQPQNATTQINGVYRCLFGVWFFSRLVAHHARSYLEQSWHFFTAEQKKKTHSIECKHQAPNAPTTKIIISNRERIARSRAKLLKLLIIIQIKSNFFFHFAAEKSCYKYKMKRKHIVHTKQLKIQKKKTNNFHEMTH